MAARNFLMLSVDDMRTIGNWGRFTPLIETPNIDRLAEMGTTFERAVTQVPLCNPARTSVLSGQQPSRTGVLDNAMVWHERVNPADTLPGVLKAAGAYVAGDRLRPGREARRYRQENGKRWLIDGPHPETREVIGGYYLLECKSEEEARAWAEKCPMWDCDVMELRPVWPEATRSRERP